MSDNIKYQKGLEYTELSEAVYSDDPPQIDRSVYICKR